MPRLRVLFLVCVASSCTRVVPFDDRVADGSSDAIGVDGPGEIDATSVDSSGDFDSELDAPDGLPLVDGAFDGAPFDASPFDASAFDASASDASAGDASPFDAGGAAWSICINRTAAYNSCAQYCTYVGKTCAEACTTTRGFPNWGAEAWLPSVAECSDDGSGQVRCAFAWDDDLGAAPRWKCCCR